MGRKPTGRPTGRPTKADSQRLALARIVGDTIADTGHIGEDQITAMIEGIRTKAWAVLANEVSNALDGEGSAKDRREVATLALRMTSPATPQPSTAITTTVNVQPLPLPELLAMARVRLAEHGALPPATTVGDGVAELPPSAITVDAQPVEMGIGIYSQR